MSACMCMLLRYMGEKTTPEILSHQFLTVVMSREFHEWHNHCLESDSKFDGETLAAGCFLIEKYYPRYGASIIPTDLEKIKLSYIRRKIPIIISGKFPMLSAWVPGTLLIKGFVDSYFVANDPRGNANTGYRDRHGENVIYDSDDLRRWITLYDEKIHLLRLIAKPEGARGSIHQAIP